MRIDEMRIPGFTAEAVFSEARRSSYSSAYFSQYTGKTNNIIIPNMCCVCHKWEGGTCVDMTCDPGTHTCEAEFQ